MPNLQRWDCPTCLQHNQFSQSIISFEGNLGKCNRCGTKAVRHSCFSNSVFNKNDMWLPILMSGISVACPTCKTTYQIAEKIFKSSNAPEWLKVTATFVGAFALVAGAIKVGATMEEWFS